MCWQPEINVRIQEKKENKTKISAMGDTVSISGGCTIAAVWLKLNTVFLA